MGIDDATTPEDVALARSVISDEFEGTHQAQVLLMVRHAAHILDRHGRELEKQLTSAEAIGEAAHALDSEYITRLWDEHCKKYPKGQINVDTTNNQTE